jgi:hypothetical protein
MGGKAEINCPTTIRVNDVRNTITVVLARSCIGGRKGHIRVSVESSEGWGKSRVVDYAPRRHAWLGWVA